MCVATHDPTSEEKNFETTSKFGYDNPNDRYKVDHLYFCNVSQVQNNVWYTFLYGSMHFFKVACHLPKDLEAVSEVVDDNLIVIKELELNCHSYFFVSKNQNHIFS